MKRLKRRVLPEDVVINCSRCPWPHPSPGRGLPCGSAGKESSCNAGAPALIPGLGRSCGEGIGYPLQDSWASLVAQIVKNPPAKQETGVQSLGWEDPLENRKATHFSILAWRIPWTSLPTSQCVHQHRSSLTPVLLGNSII